MLQYDEIGLWHYGLFILGVIVFIALDLGVFHRKSHKVGFREALGWTAVWFSMAMAFAFVVLPVDATVPQDVKEARVELEKQQAEYHDILKIHQAPDSNATNAQQQSYVTAQSATTMGVATLYSIDTATTAVASKEILSTRVRGLGS